MTRLSKKQLQERMIRLKESARAEVAKTEVMHFRLDANSIQKLYKLAGKQRKPVGTVVREWVLERIQAESMQVPQMKLSLFEVNQRLYAIEEHLKISADGR